MQSRDRTLRMWEVRIIVVIVGITLPYLMRFPGMLVHGSQWLTSFFDIGLYGVLVFQCFNATCWGTILLATFIYRDSRAVWFPVVLGFALPAFANATLDLASDAQAVIALFFVPVSAVPFAIVGAILGSIFEKRWGRND